MKIIATILVLVITFCFCMSEAQINKNTDNKFQSFWSEFKKAVGSKDINAIANLTRFPLSVDNIRGIDKKEFTQNWESIFALGGTYSKIKNSRKIFPTIGYDDKTKDVNSLREVKQKLNLSDNTVLYEFNVLASMIKFRFAMINGKIYLVATELLG